MRLYRVESKHGKGSGLEDVRAGSAWFGNRRHAAVHAKLAQENGYTTETEVVEIDLSKAGVLAFLNRYASHPDNG